MAGVPAPDYLTQKLAKRAVEIAQLTGPRKSGQALDSLIPSWQTGVIGIIVPPQSSYLSKINDGYEERVMYNLIGRVIPFRDSDGKMSFRTATSENVGTIPIINRGGGDATLMRLSRRWVTPRAVGTEFLNKAIQRSISEWEKWVSPEELLDVLKKSNLKDALQEILGK